LSWDGLNQVAWLLVAALTVVAFYSLIKRMVRMTLDELNLVYGWLRFRWQMVITAAKVVVPIWALQFLIICFWAKYPVMLQWPWQGVSFTNLLLAWVEAPVLEEFLLRGLIFWFLRRQRGPVVATAVTAIVFGFSHAVRAVPALLFFIMSGVSLALVVERTKSLIPAMLVHSVQNVIVSTLGWGG